VLDRDHDHGVLQRPKRALSVAHAHAALPGFSLIDVLVSITVIAVLIGLLLPSLSSVNETARRVVCQSNVRQVGLGVVMYADDWNGLLPYSEFLAEPQEMLLLRRGAGSTADGVSAWDGIGLLFSAGYLTAPKVFYCPSHHGENPYRLFAAGWSEGSDEIVSNYHFRGQGPTGVPGSPPTRFLYRIDPGQSSLIADAMRLRSDYNHKIGSNFFRADLTVHWFSDSERSLAATFPLTKDLSNAFPVIDAWSAFDSSANNSQ